MTPIDTPPATGGFISGDLSAPMNRPLSVAIVGAGARGLIYAQLAARDPRRSRIVAVAEPREQVREEVGRRYGIPEEGRFADWRELLERPRLADVAVIAVQDADHLAAAVGLADLGYQLLLEKPMATTEADCEAIADAARRNGIVLALCHVLRYTPYTRKVKELLAAGLIGDIVALQHLEPIGHYHFAHSFVRGNWRRADESAPLLLTKACHDIDWISHIVGRPVVRVSSFGSLTHFRPEAAPAEAPDRCQACPLQETCAYSATRTYQEGLAGQPDKAYFARVATGGDLSEEALAVALANGPYGRCVYHCDNDVVDHQVVNLEFEGGATASFTMAAFTPLENRRTRIFGTRGQLSGDGRLVEVYDFVTEQAVVHDTLLDGASAASGHAGGDEALFEAFLTALQDGRPELIVSGFETSLEGHRVVFAAERARHDGSVVTL